MPTAETKTAGGPGRSSRDLRPRAVVVGDVMTDVVVRLSGSISPFSDTPARITIAPGGSATNEAVWLARRGVEVELVAAVGDDELGRAALESVRQEGVVTHVMKSAQRKTGVVVSVVDPDGRRSMLTDRAANLDFGQARLPEGLLRSGDHLHVSGYELFDEATRAPTLELVRRAGTIGMTRSVDPCSSAPLASVGAEAFFAWTEGFDVCCANRDEGHALTGLDDPIEMAAVLTDRYPLVSLTLGEKGALVAARGAPLRFEPPLSATVVDTTGAGDAFCGAFLAAWLHGRSPDESLREGLEASASVVSTAGARPDR